MKGNEISVASHSYDAVAVGPGLGRKAYATNDLINGISLTFRDLTVPNGMQA